MEIGKIGKIDNKQGGIVNLGVVYGDVSTVVNQLPSSPDPEKPGIKELLFQLKQVVEEATELSAGEKAILLEQIKALAEVQQTPEPEKRENLLQKSKAMFEVILKNLPDTAKVAESCGKLLPLILKLLGTSV
jgi:hypothetical protein